MPEIIQISQTAYDLWSGMLKKGGSFSNENLKEILGKTVTKSLKDELLDKKLMKLRSPKGKQFYIPLQSELKVEIKIKQIEKPIKRVSILKKEEIKFSDIMTQVSKYCQPYFDKIDELTSEMENLKKTVQSIVNNQIRESHNNLNTIYNKTQSISQTKAIIKEINQSDLDEFLKILKLVCKKLDDSSRFGGEIPIYEIWRFIKQENVSLNRDIFQKYLLQLENDRKIDLHIANDPLQVRFPESGINIPRRGLIYYLSIRF